MTNRCIALAIVLSAVTVSAKLTPVEVISDQPDSPLRLTEFDAWHQDSSPYGGQYNPGNPERINYEVEIQNVSDRKVVAYRLGFVSFDVFNQYLSRSVGQAVEDLDPGDDEKMGWSDQKSNSGGFHTGVIYVDRVRFENGDIWVADLQPIGDYLMQIEENFDLTVL